MSCRYESVIYTVKEKKFLRFDSAESCILNNEYELVDDNDGYGYGFEEIKELFEEDLMITVCEYNADDLIISDVNNILVAEDRQKIRVITSDEDYGIGEMLEKFEELVRDRILSS